MAFSDETLGRMAQDPEAMPLQDHSYATLGRIARVMMPDQVVPTIRCKVSVGGTIRMPFVNAVQVVGDAIECSQDVIRGQLIVDVPYEILKRREGYGWDVVS